VEGEFLSFVLLLSLERTPKTAFGLPKGVSSTPCPNDKSITRGKSLSIVCCFC
jgi:hypothetical protein